MSDLPVHTAPRRHSILTSRGHCFHHRPCYLQLIASLFELSKAANEVSKNAIDFFNLTQAQQHAGEAASLLTASPAVAAAAAAAAAGVSSKTEPKSGSRKPSAKRQRTAKHAHAEPQPEKEHHADADGDEVSEPVVEVDAEDSEEPTLAALSTPLAVAEEAPVVEEKKTRKKRAAKDPNAPKKPLTSYILFYNHLRSSVAEKNTELSQVDIAKEIARQWKEMSESDKNYWKGIYEKDKVKYDQELAKYNASKDLLPKDVSSKDISPKESPKESPKASPKAEKRNIIDIEDAEEPLQPAHTPSAEIAEPPKKKKSKKSKKSKKLVEAA